MRMCLIMYVEKDMYDHKTILSDAKMSTEEFVKEILEKNREELGELVRLQEVLDQLPGEKSATYVVSVTSNL